MHPGFLQLLCATLLLSTATHTLAADKPLTGVFYGNGRACHGALYLRTKTVEWNSTYSACERTKYKILEQDLASEHPSVVLSLDKPSKHCRLQVIELRHYENNSWEATGYSSRTNYQDGKEPSQREALEANGKTLSCGLLKAN